MSYKGRTIGQLYENRDPTLERRVYAEADKLAKADGYISIYSPPLAVREKYLAAGAKLVTPDPEAG
jgi:hypothetical protein